MARPKINPDYNPEKARDDLVKAVADFYTAPPSDEMAGKDGKTKMKFMQQEFGLSMSKIRKLLVTAGVYEFEKDGIEMVSEIASLRTRGVPDEQIMAELSISAGTLNSLTPYKAGVYNADFTVDGYDMTNVSTDARRKRSQRKREKMKEGSVVETHKETIEDLKRKMDEQKYPGMTPEEIEIEKARRRAENEAKHQANLERKRREEEIELPEIDVETFGTEWISTKSVKGRPIGDFIFEPDFSCKYRFPDGDVHKLEPGSAIGVIDANHEKHIFGFEILGPTVAYIFRAFEIKRLTKADKVAAGQPDTEYEFSVMGDINEQDECICRLVDNAVLALQNLTITRSGRSKWGIDSPSQCLTDKYVLSANEIGRIKFVWSGRESGEVYFQVDGHTYTPEDAVKLFSAYEGWEMQYAIRSTEDILTNDMTLYPVLMNEDTFVEELGNILMALTDRHEGKFLRQEEVSVFDIMLEPVLKKLKFYYNEDRKQGEKAAASMIKLLKSVGTDSAVFPEYEIKQIKDTVK